MADPVSSNTTPSTTPPTEPKGSSMVGIITAVILLLLVIGGLMLFSRREEATPPGTEPLVIGDDQAVRNDDLGDVSLESDTNDNGPIGNSIDTTADVAVKSFTVAASNFKFDPSEIRVKQGDTVRLTLTNNSPMPHDWKLDEFNAATKVIQTGQQDTIEFVASASGTFEYYCSVGSHRQMGMVGQLIVE